MTINDAISEFRHYITHDAYCEAPSNEACEIALEALRAQQEQPNELLTYEQLQQMDGEPVWLHTFSSVQQKTNIAQWAILEAVNSAYAVFVRAGCNGRLIKRVSNYGKTWLAFRRKPKEPLTPERFESICESVHNAWWEEKKRQGVTDHPDMIPYKNLTDDVKEYDRVTVRRVLDALGISYRH